MQNISNEKDYFIFQTLSQYASAMALAYDALLTFHFHTFCWKIASCSRLFSYALQSAHSLNDRTIAETFVPASEQNHFLYFFNQSRIIHLYQRETLDFHAVYRNHVYALRATLLPSPSPNPATLLCGITLGSPLVSEIPTETLQLQLHAALKEARTDPLTGLYNRKGIYMAMTHIFSTHPAQAAFLFIDLDNFKAINDTLGHSEGDRILKETARIFRSVIRSTDIAGRIGGDEFVLLLTGITSRSAMSSRASQICQAFSHLSKQYSPILQLSCSIGIALYPQHGTDYDILAHKADLALYASKRYGKNCYAFFEDTMMLPTVTR